MGNIKLSFQDHKFYTNPATGQVYCKVKFSINMDGRFQKLLNAFIKATNYPINYVVISGSNLAPGDVFDPEIGKKVARAKAESAAYKRVDKMLQKFMDFTLLMNEDILDFFTKSSETIEYNKTYLNNF